MNNQSRTVINPLQNTSIAYNQNQSPKTFIDYFFEKFSTLNIPKATVIIIFFSIIFLYISSYYFSFSLNFTEFIFISTFFWGFITYYKTIFNIKQLDNNETILYKLNVIQNKVNDYINYKLSLLNNQNFGEILSQSDIKKIFEKNILDSLYIDSNLINFIHSIIYLFDYNNESMYFFVMYTNLILKSKIQLELFDSQNSLPNTTQSFIEENIINYLQAINYLQSTIYTIPKNITIQNNLYNIIKTYSSLMKTHLKFLYNINKKFIDINGININTKFNLFNNIKAYPSSKNVKEINNINQLFNFFI